MDTRAAESFHHLVVARILDENGCPRIPARWIDVSAAIDAVIVEDDDADRQVKTADRFEFHARESKGRVPFDSEHRLAGFNGRADCKAHADAHHAPGADVETFAWLVHVDNATREVERVRAFVHQDGVRPLLYHGAERPKRPMKLHRSRVLLELRRHLRS